MWSKEVFRKLMVGAVMSIGTLSNKDGDSDDNGKEQ